MDFNTFFELVKTEMFNLHPVEIVTTVTAIIYLLLAARENVWCWFFGIISCAFFAWANYYLYNLQIDFWLQIFYVAISFWGLYQWKFGSQEKKELPITKLSLNEHLGTIGGGLLLSGIVGWLYANYSSTSEPYLDAFTTLFSIFTTFMVIHKKLENWLYWIVVDMAYVYLFWIKEVYLFSVLFAVYVIIASLGWIEWQNKYKKGYQT
jgi:nicotinamide mononucleotide transporter